jgi:hypothetical protein
MSDVDSVLIRQADGNPLVIRGSGLIGIRCEI